MEKNMTDQAAPERITVARSTPRGGMGGRV